MEPQTLQLLHASGMAVLTHLHLRHNEPGPFLLFLVVIEPTVLVALSKSVPVTIGSILAVHGAFFACLISSIVLYRLSPFHPLARYPGPVLHKMTQFRNVWVQTTGHQHLVLKQLHDTYGPIVRIGPNELSVIDVNAALSILGTGGLPKGRFYEARKDPNAPENLLVMGGHAHTDRRRLWTRAFTNSSIAEYDDALIERVNSLLEGLAESSKLSTSIDLSFWIGLFALDFMGDMAFGDGFGMLRDGADKKSILPMFDKFVVSISILSQVPWAAPYVLRLPFLSKNIVKLRHFAVSHGMARAKKGGQRKDLWYHIADEAGIDKTRPSVRDVIGDSALAMIAGSDTTATGLSSLFYFLLSNPECLKRVQAEIDEVFLKDENPCSAAKHSELPYLTMCINETLRLLPPAPSSGPREVPKGCGGRTFNGFYFPEGTQILVPPYSMHRTPEYFFPGTNDFIPERWETTPKDDARHNLDAFIPFSYGPANCVGKSLARREMMMVASAILQRFDLRFAEGFEPSAYLDELHDHFVTKRGALMVRLSPRY